MSEKLSSSEVSCRKCGVVARPGGEPLLRCSACRQAYYCCVEHQNCKRIARANNSKSSDAGTSLNNPVNDKQQNIENYLKNRFDKNNRRPSLDEEDEDIRFENAVITEYLEKHPCPPAAKIQAWLDEPRSGRTEHFRCTCEGLGYGKMTSEDLHYESIKTLWDAASYVEDEFQVHAAALLPVA